MASRVTDARFVESVYLSAYANDQRGSGSGSIDGIPVFQGERYHRQNGAGFGAVVKGIGKFLLPMLFKGGVSAANSFMESRDSGKTVKESLKDAVIPGATSAIATGAQKGIKKLNKIRSRRHHQKGRGRKTRALKRVYKGRKRGGHTHYNF